MLERDVRLVIGAVFAGSTLAVVAMAAQQVVPVGFLTRDAAFTAGEAWYLGAFSSLGLVGWAAAATTLGVASLVASRRDSPALAADALALLAVISAVLLLDDMFQLHEDVGARIIGSEVPFQLGYVCLGVWWLVAYARRFDSGLVVLLVLVGGCFASSVITDLFWHSDSAMRLLAEDGSKFAGIWTLGGVGVLAVLRVSELPQETAAPADETESRCRMEPTDALEPADG